MSRILFVYLARLLVLAPVACAPLAVQAAGFDRTLELWGVRFHVTCPNEGSINKVTIRATGLPHAKQPIVVEVDGTVTGAEVEDLNGDRFPEIYVYVDRKSTRLNSSHVSESRMPSSA